MKKIFFATLLLTLPLACATSTKTGTHSADDSGASPPDVPDVVETLAEVITMEVSTPPPDVEEEGDVPAQPQLPTAVFEEMCEQQKGCGFHSATQACLDEMKGVWYSLSSQGCRDTMLEMLTECATGPPNPCIPRNTPKCQELIATFQSACMGIAPQGEAAARWSHVCEAYKMKEPKDCDPSVTMEDVIELCEFVGATLKNTEECLEKIDLYLECLPQTQYYCEPGNLMPRPDPKTGCYKEADPFTFPTGECIEQ